MSSSSAPYTLTVGGPMEPPPTISLPPLFMRDNPSDRTHPCFETMIGYDIAAMCNGRETTLIYARSHTGHVALIDANQLNPGLGGQLFDYVKAGRHCLPEDERFMSLAASLGASTESLATIVFQLAPAA